MPQYRAYVVGSDNVVASAADYEFEDDDVAVGSITALYSLETVELWSGTRRVAKIVAGVVLPDSTGLPSDAAGETPQRGKRPA
jgi:hypothetical protein